MSENFPGADLDGDGVCSFCRRRDTGREREAIIANRDKIDRVIAENRGTGIYDIVLSYSGGKDSSLTLLKLRRDYDLRVLALMVDIDFVSPLAFDNARRLCSALDVDLVINKPSTAFMRRMFRVSIEDDIYGLRQLTRASAACLSCISLIQHIVLKEAAMRGVPLVAGGYVAGQLPATAGVVNPGAPLFRQSRQAGLDILIDKVSPRFENYRLGDDRLPLMINPLLGEEYDEDAVVDILTGLGWEKPRDTGQSSSNCLINDYAIAVNIEKHGFHPYEAEICDQVRRGAMSPERAAERLAIPRPSKEFPEIIRKLREAD